MNRNSIIRKIIDSIRSIEATVFVLFASVIIFLTGADKHDTWPDEKELLKQSKENNEKND